MNWWLMPIVVFGTIITAYVAVGIVIIVCEFIKDWIDL